MTGQNTEPPANEDRESHSVHLGALDLLGIEHMDSLFPVGDVVEGGLEEEDQVSRIDALDGSFDLIVMNPPFTRPTNHEAGHATVPVPSFAGFETSAAEQAAMSRALKDRHGDMSHGNAGLASNFLELADRKLKTGGVLAFVLPFSFAARGSWEKARNVLGQRYGTTCIVSIASSGKADRAFSADTGMAECLLLARKGGNRDARAANFAERLQSILAASNMARGIGWGRPDGSDKETYQGAYRDEVRQALDRQLLIDVLGLDSDLLDGLDLVRRQWCAEPSVHGGKPTRPPGT